MIKQKVLIVFGTRPEAIKMAPLVKEFMKYPTQFEVQVCVTAQHRHMLDQVLSFFDITADYDLNIMKVAQDLTTLSANILLAIEPVLKQAQPDYVFVHGDTTTSSITALAAYYQRIKVCHVEAGLRTYNKYSPFPEEINRQITARIASLHFAPTSTAQNNLLAEGIEKHLIYTTGNTVIDALYMATEKLTTFEDDKIAELKQLVDTTKKLVLVTAHRRENFGEGFINICLALKDIAEGSDVQIIYPVHLNPNVKDVVHHTLNGISNVHLIAPISYPAFVWLMRQSYLILTDSGGVQEEAPGLGKPVLVMRETTERPEAVEAGTVKLVGASRSRLVAETNFLLNDTEAYKQMSHAVNPYGDGKACERIVNAMINQID